MSITEGFKPQEVADAELALSFPANFIWGAATSAYQIEGATREDGRGASIWDTFSATPGAVYRGDTGDIAVDHYHRTQEDLALMAGMGLNSYCFSIAWPRILPDGTGAVNSRGLDFYERLVDDMLAKGIVPFAKLYHWDLPQALEDRGGWRNRETALAFADYAEIVARRLGDRVPYWLTHNEPWCAAFLGYGIGIHAPGVRDRQAAVDAAHHLLLSHGLAIPRLRTYTNPQAQLAITLNLYPIYPADDSPETQHAVKYVDTFKNRWFLDPIFRGSYPEDFFQEFGTNPPPIQDGDFDIISTPIDILGVNYYSRNVVRGLPVTKSADGSQGDFYEEIPFVPGSSYTAMNWEVYPEGLYDMLARLHRDYKPRSIMVTENGAAYDDQWNGNDQVSDPERLEYLRTHIQAVAKALEHGVPMNGYFAWSLTDNFEWAEGYNKRFGIVYVDYPTQRRIIKDSGRWYASFIGDTRSL